MAYVGIDFGTSNSVVADFRFGKPVVLRDAEGRATTPSVVTLRRDGSIAIGQEAKEAFDERRSIRSVKRVLGQQGRVRLAGKEIRPEQVAVMLFSMLRRGAEAALSQAVTHAVITVPANSKGLARHATKMCASAGGVRPLALINEPTAAAIAYGLHLRQDHHVLVYDFGGGTLDVTVLRIHHGVFEEIGSKGIGLLGGDDADELLAEMLAERFRAKTGYEVLTSPHRTAFMLAVERAKFELSDSDVATAHRPRLVPELGLDLEEVVTREQYERLIRPLVERSGTAITEALGRAGIGPGALDHVLLVGGMGMTPLVREYVTQTLGRAPEPFAKADPLTCVAQGAAIASAILQGAPGTEHLAYSVKLEHSLCSCPVDAKGKPFLDPIIRRGSDIPCSHTKIYFPFADPAERIAISVYEGDSYDDPDDLENVKLAEIPWTYHPPRRASEAGIEVTYQYADDGILSVEIAEQTGGRSRRFTIEQAAEDSPGPQFAEKAREATEGLLERTNRFTSHSSYLRAQEMLRRAEQTVLPQLTATKARDEVEELCRGLRQALGAGDLNRADEVAALLDNRLLAFAKPS